ncbi:uncharacterized protein ALTATR162_LOCUS961 [Alternaria atra]|uniref:Uncharacterized protein n=1 Tax=Alternaria atra TaxID=119953 RepID=A0A8J2HW13_9PLEO|nr:uncharacterized protein ALTATR162_LOCUS961 [Alternaria atra]CAG5141526.1 unnamed protein product [Alternaria atra]
MLYEANTFAILHNTVLIDFRRAALASHLSRVRSLHVHFQFRELNQHRRPLEEQQGFPSPWSLKTFTTCGNEPDIASAIGGFPDLESLSVFIQGPLTSEETYRQICGSLRSIQRDLRSLRFMMVRFPRPFPDEVVQLRAQYDGQDPIELVRRVLEKEEAEVRHGYRIVQPSLEPGQNAYDMADSDAESKWRVGTIYMQSSGEADGVATRNYAVLRPERETKTYKTDSKYAYFQVPVIGYQSSDDLYGSGYRALNWPPRHNGLS